MASIRNGLAGTRGIAAAAGLIAAGAVLAAGTPALAQAGGGAGGAGSAGAQQQAPTGNPARTNLMRMGRRITIELTDQRLEDVLNFITEVTGAEIEPAWRTDLSDGLDRDARINLKATNLPALTLLEQVLERAQTDFMQNTWQLTSYGTIEVGPKERLNRNKRLEIYDINDLLIEVPRFYGAPQIDLQGVLQQSQGGGGGGQSPFTQIDQEEDEEERRQERDDRIRQLIDLIITFVETEQWQDNGGSGGTIRYFQGTLIVNAPDYMHRQLNGYTFWPERSVQTSPSGRRYVSLNMDTGISTLDGFGREPVTAVVGGRLIRSGPGPGGSTGQPQQPGQNPGTGGGGEKAEKPAPPATSEKPK